MHTIALYTRAVNIVKKKYVLCKILFCARIITRAAHSARGKKKRLQSKLQPKLLLKYFFVFHNEASDINIVSRGDAADKPAQNNINHKENNIRRALLFIICISRRESNPICLKWGGAAAFRIFVLAVRQHACDLKIKNPSVPKPF